MGAVPDVFHLLLLFIFLVLLYGLETEKWTAGDYSLACLMDKWTVQYYSLAIQT